MFSDDVFRIKQRLIKVIFNKEGQPKIKFDCP